MTNWTLTAQRPPPPARHPLDTMTFKLRLLPYSVAATWFQGAWLMPPHWDDLPGEEIVAWKRSPDQPDGFKS